MSISVYYHNPTVIDRPIGNNAFVYDERKQLFGRAEIVIPTMIDGNIDSVKVGNIIVFAENMDGEVKEFVGLERLVMVEKSTYIMDNHNHALYCWYKEYLS